MAAHKFSYRKLIIDQLEEAKQRNKQIAAFYSNCTFSKLKQLRLNVFLRFEIGRAGWKR